MSDDLHIPYRKYASDDELTEEERDLLEKAWEASHKAYVPYSGFYVGCAVLLESGEIILGNNQENAAYPSGTCAERTALFYVGSQGKGDQITKIAIRAWSERKPVEQPVTPCGACRQVMVEYERQGQKDIEVLMQGASGPILKLSGIQKTLLPFSFDIDF